MLVLLTPNSSSADILVEKQQQQHNISSIPLNTEGYVKGKGGTLKKKIKGCAISVIRSTRELSLEILSQ